MKKILIGAAIVVVLFGVFGAAGYFYARTTSPALFNQGYGMMGNRGGAYSYQRNGSQEVGRGGMMGGRGGMMGYQGNGTQEGILHDKMVAAFAEKLGMSTTDLETQLNKGETMYQVATTKGITTEQFTTMMTEVRTQVIDQAVKDGTLTQEQADWMKQRGAGMGNGTGRGAGRGGFNGMDCPFDGDES